MTVPFSETTRSLAGESRLSSIVAVLAAVVLLALWVVWLFLGELPQRIEGRGVMQGDRIVVELDASRVAKQQPAVVTSLAGQHPPLRAEVSEVEPSVVLRVLGPVEPSVDQGSSEVHVEIEVARPSPWQLLEDALRD